LTDDGSYSFDIDTEFELIDDGSSVRFDAEIQKQKDIDNSFQRKLLEMTKEEQQQVDELTKLLVSNLSGANGTETSFRATKTLCTKALGQDRDKVYKKEAEGHKRVLKFNVLIDRSGSMSGNPIRNSVLLVYILNLLAEQGLAQVKVFNSSSNRRTKLVLPVGRNHILNDTKVTGDEGLYKTSKAYEDDIKNTPLVCLSDFSIVDQPIVKTDWDKLETDTLGLYINSRHDVRESNKGKRWFNKAYKCGTLEQAVEKIIMMRW
jgi:hypothetical protein